MCVPMVEHAIITIPYVGWCCFPTRGTLCIMQLQTVVGKLRDVLVGKLRDVWLDGTGGTIRYCCLLIFCDP